jgi:DNA-directed RNA polymerase-5 subunit 1
MVTISHVQHIPDVKKVQSGALLCLNNEIVLLLQTPAFLLLQDHPPLCVSQVKKSNGARSLELKAPLKQEVADGFWSFLDQFGFHTSGTSHRRPLHPKEVLNDSGQYLHS